MAFRKSAKSSVKVSLQGLLIGAALASLSGAPLLAQQPQPIVLPTSPGAIVVPNSPGAIAPAAAAPAQTTAPKAGSYPEASPVAIPSTPTVTTAPATMGNAESNANPNMTRPGGSGIQPVGVSNSTQLNNDNNPATTTTSTGSNAGSTNGSPLVKPSAKAYNGTSASTQLLPNANPFKKSDVPPDPWKMVTVTENNPAYTVEVKYPQFDSIKGNDPSKLNEEVKRYVMAQIDAARAVMPSAMKHIEGPKPLSYIKGSCVVSAYRPDLCSMTVDLTNYQFQSAHPVEALSTFNYRLDTHEQFGLQQLFRPEFKYIPAVSKMCIALMSEGLDEEGIEWIKRGAAPEEKNFGKFQVTDRNLIFIFDPYTVDNGADGFKQVPISWDRLRANVNSAPVFKKLVAK